MPRSSGRNVVRATRGKQALVAGYGRRKWYQLPDWLAQWLVGNSYWVAGVLCLILAPVALLALVIGAKSLPLEFLGIPSSANGAGLATVMLVAKFALVGLAIRPLYRRSIRGWYFLTAASAVHMAHGYILQHGIIGTAVFALSVYLTWQLRRWYR